MFVITQTGQAEEMANVDFFEKRIRPLLVKHCYECHSEQEKEQMGGLLLDRQSGWLKGGDTTMAVIPGEPKTSLLMEAILYKNENLQMPPKGKLSDAEIKYFAEWIHRGAPGPENDLGDSAFSQLGDQELLFEQAKEHWAFQPIAKPTPPQVGNALFNRLPIDQFIFSKMQQQKLTPSRHADPRSMLRRLSYDLTGLPPTSKEVEAFPAKLRENRPQAIQETVDRLIESPAFGEKMARMWLDVARYADTDSRYRPDTKTPHYFPFAFTYRDYVIKAFNADKPFNQFVKEQLAADLMGFQKDASEQAALGFLAVGPHAGGSVQEEIDDWIDVTSRGLLGLTVACARCHDHKYEPIPTADYYALHGVFNSVDRANPLNEKLQPEIQGYTADKKSQQDYLKQRKAIDEKIKAAGNSKAKGNNRSVAQKIRETELAALLTYHPAAPARAMVVSEKKKPIEPRIFIRGDASNRGDNVPRKFLQALDESQTPFSDKNSGRLELAEKIASPDNPLTARVFVNRVWGMLMGSYLVDAPSNFGLMTAAPIHSDLLDWLANDFIEHDWSVKHLVRTIVLSNTYLQSSYSIDSNESIDPENRYYWRANRKHLSIEELRDSMLAVSGVIDLKQFGHSAPLWGEEYTRRRSIYGFINRFNLDPTLRAFDFPTPMQTQSERTESVVATQSLFAMNSDFVLDQAVEITNRPKFREANDDQERIEVLFELIFQRPAAAPEINKITRFLELQDRFKASLKKSPATAQSWPLVAQSILMSNEFQYLD